MIDAYEKILNSYDNFSARQKKVADYIINHIDEALYFPISKFAQTIGVSQPTIVRFAQHLGYDGFNQFRDSLFSYYRNLLSPENRMKHSIEALEEGLSTYSKIINNEIVYLEKSEYTIDESTFCQVVDKIHDSSTVYIIALGANEYLGTYLEFKFRRLKLNYRLVSDSGREMLENLLTIDEKDCAIVFNFSKPSIDFSRLMSLLSDKKVPSILITDIKTPPAVRLSTYVLYAERGPKGTFQSPVVPMAITNSLYLRIAEKLEEKAIEALRELGELRDNYFYTDRFKH